MKEIKNINTNTRGAKMKKILMVSAVVATLASVLPNTTFASSSQVKFKDLSTSNWAYSYIMEGVSKGYISGDPGGTFRPNDPVTVAEFIKMLFMSMTDTSMGFRWWSENYTDNLPYSSTNILNTGTMEFVNGSPWYQNYVQTAKNLGVIKDEFDGNYNDKLTREKASRIIDNFDTIFNGAYQYDYAMFVGGQIYKDFSKVDSFLKESVADVGLRGIMVGNEKGNFNPKAYISRAEVAKICSFETDKTKRTPPKNLNLSNAPISTVSSSFGDMQFMFKNQEMKKVYDSLRASQGNYNGSTYESTGSLYYYQNDDLRDESIRATNTLDLENMSKVNYDGLVNFDGGAYTFRLATAGGRFDRFSPVLNQFLSLVFKSNASDVYTMIQNSVNGNSKSVDKTIENRQVRIDYLNNYVSVGISAYIDKK